LAWHYYRRSYTDGVKHAEVFFDPQAHLSEESSTPLFFRGFSAQRKERSRSLELPVQIIACFLRHIPVSDSLSVFDHKDVQQSFADGHVIGVGIDSSEVDYPPAMFSEIFRKRGRFICTARLTPAKRPLRRISKAL